MSSIKIEPFESIVSIIIRDTLSPAAQSREFARFARETLAEAEAANARALGAKPRHRAIVDGNEGAALESVRPDGRIVFEFDLISRTLHYIASELRLHSPIKTGAYVKSHKLFIDDEEVAPAEIDTLLQRKVAQAREFVFVPTVNYARPIERGWSKKAPDGVYQVVAALARKRYGGFLLIKFDWRSVTGMRESKRERKVRPNAPRDMRQPAIIVTWK